jgi:CRP-like cAMP-binding protein
MTETKFFKYIDTLKKCILFKGIKIDEYQYVLDCLSPVVNTYKSGSSIAIEGEYCPGTCIVLSGTVSILKSLPTGESNIMDVCIPGEIFGEVSAFSEHKNWPASVTAREDSEVMIIPADKFIHTCGKQCGAHTKLTENMLITLSEKVIILNKKMSYILLKSLRAKISCYLLEQFKKKDSKTFMLPFSRNELADFLNVTRPSLSRELSRMRDDGLIDFHRSAIKILNPEMLAKYASES